MRKFKAAVFAIAFACGAATAAEPIIDTIAGGGTSRDEGIPAKQATLDDPKDVAVDAAGNVYIADSCRIRKVTKSGIITTIAGDGTNVGTAPLDGMQATSGTICSKTVAVDGFGYVYYASGARIGKIAPTGVVTLVAGTGYWGYLGDGGPALSARVHLIDDMTFDAAGNLYFTDSNRIRKITRDGIINTFAGNGIYGDDGEYGPATAASISPTDLVFDHLGNLFFINGEQDSAIRKVDTSGMITSVWGRWPNYRSDPVALGTDSYIPSGLATDPAGNLYVGNRANFVSVISPENGIRHIVGTYNDTTWDNLGYGALHGFEGDGGPALAAKLDYPEAIALDAQGNLYIADAGNYRIRKVTGPLPVPDPLPSGAYAFDHATPPIWASEYQLTEAIDAGDANGDGLTDLFLLTGVWDKGTTYPGDLSLHVFRQKPDGTIAAPQSYRVASIGDFITIDLNHDRYVDVVLSGAYGLYVMLGGANGMAQPVRYTLIGNAVGTFQLHKADMNRDGHMDVITMMSTGGDGAGAWANWAIYYSNGDGTLGKKVITPVTDAHDPLIGDFNDDAWPDMLFPFSTLDDSGVSVAYHNGVDNVLPEKKYPAGSRDRSGNYSAVADFDHDGTDDIIFTFDHNAPEAKFTHWVRKPGGGFDYVREWRTYDSPTTMIAEDMNKDGLTDLLAMHTGWSAIGYMQQARAADGAPFFDREVKAYAIVYNAPLSHGMMVGDFNNDACRDVVASGSSSSLQIQYGHCLGPTLRRVAHDYDGDGRSDILWRNGANGANAVWQAANLAAQLTVTGVTNPAWKIVGQGDFDKDDRDDLVWRNTSTGANTIWRSANSSKQIAMPTVSLAWSVVGVGDFDGDGADDLLWRNTASGANAIWRSGNNATQLPVTGVTNLQWQVAGVGDFDDDGMDDILWRNTASGANAIWRSANHATQIAVTGVSNLAWKVQGVGDFDGDRRADLFWRNPQTGVNTIWKGASSDDQRTVIGVTGAQWQVSAVGDYDADGEDDLLWRNGADGRIGLWRSGNALKQRWMLGVSNTAWSVVR